MREALATFNSNLDGGAFIITSSIAGRIPVSLILTLIFCIFIGVSEPRSRLRHLLKSMTSLPCALRAKKV